LSSKPNARGHVGARYLGSYFRCANSLETATLGEKGFYDVGKGPGSRAGDYIEWLTIKDNARSVRDDVERIRQHALVPANIAIYGYIYDVKSGKLLEVPEATALGKAA
jgi:carbonic anhydrase